MEDIKENGVENYVMGSFIIGTDK